MKHTAQMGLLYVGCIVSLLGPRPLLAQACKDEEMMTNENKKSLVEVVEVVKKETFPDFQRAYHQRSCLNKLTFAGTAVGSLLGCLEKASQDSTAAKEEVDAYKARRDVFAKLKEKIDGDRKTLKAAVDAGDGKSAKAIIEKFSYAN